MDDSSILVAEIAFDQGIALDLRACELIAQNLKEGEIDSLSVRREAERIGLVSSAIPFASR